MNNQINVTCRSRAASFVTTSATVLLLAAALLPNVASATDGTITFSGAIYESPCDVSTNSVTCYSGIHSQSMDLANLQKAGTLKSISSTLNYAVSASNSNVAIVTVSYM
ncbi:fimbrial protein [Aeromonas cavernicola]|uniref:Fimbrial protein n=1 Tax=Aeromonas cavernicola TaxID=1006623 RepID=A0A2H9U0Y2_9GAMM|nr:fimbrial protein [Aeromonas cavernicola]PJG57702.1 fimbrial protein [Aeromonas cavernicola]